MKIHAERNSRSFAARNSKSRCIQSVFLLVLMGFPVGLTMASPPTGATTSDGIITEARPSIGPFHGVTLKLYGLMQDRVSQDLVSELVLTDPQGRRTGRDPKAKVEYEEIPRSAYGEEGIGRPVMELDVREPPDASYQVQVIGTRRGSYDLYIYPQDENADSPNQPFFANIPTAPGMVHLYTLDYTRTHGVPLKVTGGFGGEGEKPGDVNQFLTYANPIAAQTTLRPGKTPFPLIIFYGATIDPASFTATLNGANISRRFKPIPGRYQVVPLKFALGSNTLILSVQGKTASAEVATDTDQFGFSVR